MRARDASLLPLGILAGLLLGYFIWAGAAPPRVNAPTQAGEVPSGAGAAPLPAPQARQPVASHQVEPALADPGPAQDKSPAASDPAQINPWGEPADFRANVSGVVVDSDGKPVAGATVTGRLLHRLVNPYVGAELDGDEQVLATTDALGRFDYQLDTRVGEFTELTLLLWAGTGDSPRRTPERVSLRNGAAVADVRLVLETRGRITGRIVGPNGRVLAGAEVGTYPPHSRIWTVDNVVKTDANGEFVIENLDQGGYGISVSYADHKVAKWPLYAQLTGALLELGDIELRCQEILAGTLVAAEGTELRRTAIVEFRTIEGNVLESRQATLDAQGAFKIAGAPTGTMDVIVRMDGFAPSPPVRVYLQPENTADTGTVTLQPE
jgi:hypothetical protein